MMTLHSSEVWQVFEWLQRTKYYHFLAFFGQLYLCNRMPNFGVIHAFGSVFVLDQTTVRSPRQLLNYIIEKYVDRIKLSLAGIFGTAVSLQ